MLYFFCCENVKYNYYTKLISFDGWTHSIRNHGSLLFFDLKDKSGILQVFFEKKRNNLYFLNFLKLGYCLNIVGILNFRKSSSFNFFLNTGYLEVFLLRFIIINFSKKLSINLKKIIENEYFRLKNRFLDLRRFYMYNNLSLKFNFIKYFFNFFNFEKFINIETPILCRSTSEGSREYVVPCRFFNNLFFTLNQSPQIFKQILMISNFDKYFQLVKCFRDEDLKFNRQIEFYQFDFEMSFYDTLDILCLFEYLIFFFIFKIFNFNINKFFFISYKNSINNFYTDKPDLKFKFFFFNFYYYLNYLFTFKYFCFYCFNFFNYIFYFGNNFLNYKFILNSFEILNLHFFYFNHFIYFFNLNFFTNIFIYEIFSFLKFNFFNYFVFFSFNFNKNNIFKKILFINYLKFNKLLNYYLYFLWIFNFPLFNYNFICKKYINNSNPFSKPLLMDILYLDIFPLNCFCKSYDIILNGIEIGGGSVRNDKLFLQKKIFLIIINCNYEVSYKFNFFFKILFFAPPKHLGAAFGVDRFFSIILGLKNIKDIIPFPKSNSNNCFLSFSPNFIF